MQGRRWDTITSTQRSPCHFWFSHLWTGMWVAWLQNSLHCESLHRTSLCLWTLFGYTLLFSSDSSAFRDQVREESQALPNDSSRMTTLCPSLLFVWITLAFGIRKALCKICKNRSQLPETSQSNEEGNRCSWASGSYQEFNFIKTKCSLIQTPALTHWLYDLHQSTQLTSNSTCFLICDLERLIPTLEASVRNY